LHRILDGMEGPRKNPQETLEGRVAFAGSSLAFLDKLGLHRSAACLWELYRVRHLFDGAANMPPEDWKGGTCKVNFHNMNRGTALVAFNWAIQELRRTYDTQGLCPGRLVLVTGRGLRSREPGVSQVKLGVEKALLLYRIPFSEEVGAFVVMEGEVKGWFDNPAHAGLPELHDDWPL